MGPYACIVCLHWKPKTAFSEQELHSSRLDRRCRSCEPYVTTEARLMLQPIAHGLESLGLRLLQKLDLRQTVMNLLLLQAFQSICWEVDLSVCTYKRRVEQELHALLDLPYNYALIQATPRRFVVAFVPMRGACAGQAFKVSFDIDPLTYPSKPAIVSVRGTERAWAPSTQLAMICRLVEERVCADDRGMWRGLEDGIAGEFSHLAIVQESLGCLQYVLDSPSTIEAYVFRFMSYRTSK